MGGFDTLHSIEKNADRDAQAKDLQKRISKEGVKSFKSVKLREATTTVHCRLSLPAVLRRCLSPLSLSPCALARYAPRAAICEGTSATLRKASS